MNILHCRACGKKGELYAPVQEAYRIGWKHFGNNQDGNYYYCPECLPKSVDRNGKCITCKKPISIKQHVSAINHYDCFKALIKENERLKQGLREMVRVAEVVINDLPAENQGFAVLLLGKLVQESKKNLCTTNKNLKIDLSYFNDLP